MVVMSSSRLVLCGLALASAQHPQPQPQSHSLECSREASRRVRSYLGASVYPKLSIGAESLPLTCQIHPSLDLYRVQELSKQEVARGDWKCLYCGKHFRSEFYIDRHMHNMHRDRLDKAATTCLADLCPIFGCDQNNHGLPPLAASSSGTVQHTPSHGHRRKDFQASRCTQSEVERSKYRCEVMTKRCFGLLDAPLQKAFYDRICAKLHCHDGTLRGILRDAADTEPIGSFVFWVLRALVAGMLLVFVFCYVLFVGVPLSKGRDRGMPVVAASSPSVRALRSTFDSLSLRFSPPAGVQSPVRKKRM